MGTNVSKSVTDVVNESSMEVTNKIVSNLEQKAYQGSISNQINHFNAVEISGCCGSIDMSNDASVDQYMVTELSIEQSIDLIQELVNKLESEFEKTIEQQANALPGINVTESRTKVRNTISSLVENEVLISTVQSSVQTAASLQQNYANIGILTCPCIYDSGGELIKFDSFVDMSNKSVISQVGEAMATQVLDILSDTSIEQDLEASFIETISQKTNDFTGIIIALVLLAIAGIGLVLALKSLKKKAAINKYRVNNGSLNSLLNNKI